MIILKSFSESQLSAGRSIEENERDEDNYYSQTSPLSNNEQQQTGGGYVKMVGGIYEKPRSAPCSAEG